MGLCQSYSVFTECELEIYQVCKHVCIKCMYTNFICILLELRNSPISIELKSCSKLIVILELVYTSKLLLQCIPKVP